MCTEGVVVGQLCQEVNFKSSDLVLELALPDDLLQASKLWIFSALRLLGPQRCQALADSLPRLALLCTHCAAAKVRLSAQLLAEGQLLELQQV